MSNEPAITSWSYSRWKDYETCPLKAKLKHVDKLKEPSGPAAARGTLVHSYAEEYVKSPRKPKTLPAELKHFKQEIETLRKRRAVPEQRWGLTNTWEPMDFFAPGVWARLVVDVVLKESESSLLIIDYKTGKKRPDHSFQLSLYAAAGFVYFPTIKTISVENWYLDLDDVGSDEYTREEDFEGIKKVWSGRVAPLMNDRRFAPRPGPYCGWCAFSNSKGGPCKF